MIRLVVVSTLFGLAACSPPARTYAPGVEQNFTRACESRSAAPGFCTCVWDKIEANVAPDDFAALEQMAGPEREASPLMHQLQGYQTACLAAVQREPQPAP